MNAKAYLLTAAGVVLLLGAPIAVAAANASAPGDPLYGLDRALEQVPLSLPISANTKADIRLGYARERLQELQTLNARGNATADKVKAAADDYKQQIEDSLQELKDSGTNDPDTQKSIQSLAQELNDFRTELTTLQGQTQDDGIKTELEDAETKTTETTDKANAELPEQARVHQPEKPDQARGTQAPTTSSGRESEGEREGGDD